MEDQYNLIYNGKMLHGMDGYATACGSQTMTIDTTDKPVGCAASYTITNNGAAIRFYETRRSIFPLIPYDNTCVYSWNFQIKNNGSSFILPSLIPFDNKGNLIYVDCAFSYEPNGSTVTSLARDLNNGDTVVYLTDVSKWIADTTYRNLGIIESAAYKDNRCLSYKRITQNGIDTTNNTITLSSGWAGGTYKAGSKVREFSDDITYLYPHGYLYPTSTWGYKSATFSKSLNNSEHRADNRLLFSYFLGLGYIDYNCKLADLRFENTTKPQARVPNGTDMLPLFSNSGNGTIDDYSESTSSVNQYGQLNTGMLSEGFLPVRYIRDNLNGSTAIAASHWCEIQAFDRWGRNVAFAADGSLPSGYKIYSGAWDVSRYGLNQANTTTYKPMHCITTGIPNYNNFIEGIYNSASSIIIDMGIIHYIDKIKVWHYWPDGRTYHNTKTEVSVDGVNWVTVFDSAIEGEYQETSAGHTITFDKLGTLYHASMKKGGETLVQDVYED